MEKSINKSVFVVPAVYIVLGLVMVIFPETTMKTFCFSLGAIAAVMGIINLVTYFSRDAVDFVYRYDFVNGVLLIMLGLLFIVKMEMITELIPVLLGVLILANGIMKLQHAIDLKRIEFNGWLYVLVFSLLCLSVGAVCILRPAFIATTLIILMGISFLFCGLTDFITLFFMSKKLKEYLAETSEEADKAEYEKTETEAEAAAYVTEYNSPEPGGAVSSYTEPKEAEPTNLSYTKPEETEPSYSSYTKPEETESLYSSYTGSEETSASYTESVETLTAYTESDTSEAVSEAEAGMETETEAETVPDYSANAKILEADIKEETNETKAEKKKFDIKSLFKKKNKKENTDTDVQSDVNMEQNYNTVSVENKETDNTDDPDKDNDSDSVEDPDIVTADSSDTDMNESEETGSNEDAAGKDGDPEDKESGSFIAIS